MRRRVSNRGAPPETFLDELIGWAKTAPLKLFAPNVRHDIYTNVSVELGPWRSLEHRRAVMVECLRVLAGFESSWDWYCGRDVTNPASITAWTKETGAFQVSADSMDLDPSLRTYILQTFKSDAPETFIRGMKENHRVAVEYAARVLRVTVRHHGPVLRREINPWLSRAAVREAERLIREDVT